MIPAAPSLFARASAASISSGPLTGMRQHDPERPGGALQLSPNFGRRTAGVAEYHEARRRRHGLSKQLDVLLHETGDEDGQARHVAARTCQRSDKAFSNRIRDQQHHDGDVRCRLLDCPGLTCCGRDNYVNSRAEEFSDEARKILCMALRERSPDN